MVGVGSYKNQAIAPLRYAASDALDIAKALQGQQGDQAFREIVPLVDTEATLANVKKWLDEKTPVHDPSDQVFIYFSGHGAVDKDGQPYLCVYDTDPSNLAETALSISYLNEIVDKAKAGRFVVVFDCSFAARPDADSLSDDLGRFKTLNILPPDPAIAGGKAYFENLAARPGGDKRALVLTACMPDETALEYVYQLHGSLTYFFLEALYGAAGTNERGMVTMEQIIGKADNPGYVPNKVAEVGALGYPQTVGVFGDRSLSWSVKALTK
jgi:hypothetical protein